MKVITLSREYGAGGHSIGTKVAVLDNLPDSLEYIGSHAFYNCHSLSSVILGSNIKTIGNRAFESCDLLKKITIPEWVRFIDEQQVNMAM